MNQKTLHNIQLLSNASMKVYPKNKPQNFTNILFTPLELQGDYEAALTELIYPNNWFNLTEDCTFDATISYGSHNAASVPLPQFKIPKGYYNKIDKICDYINAEFARKIGYVLKGLNLSAAEEPVIKAEYNSVTQRVNLTTTKCIATITVTKSTQLFTVLGLPIKVNTPFQIPLEGTNQANINIHFPCLFVYCSIVEPQLIGDTSSQILRIVPVQGENQEVICDRFVDPSFVRVNSGYISSMQIKICTDSGIEVPFEAGKVIASIRIRKCGI